MDAIDNNIKYRFVKKQKGGGTWGQFSFDNDYTHDLLIDFRDGETKKFYNNKQIDSLLDKMFEDFEKRNIRPKDKHIKNISFSDYNLNTACDGVVVYLLINGVHILRRHLDKTLAHLYKDYQKVYLTKESSGWRNYEARLEALKIEICLINYKINNGTINKIMDVITHNINSKDILAGNIFIGKNNKKILDYISKNKKEFFDYLYIKPDKFLPYLNPNIVYDNMTMQGKNKYKQDEYYIVVNNGKTKKWKKYDPYEDVTHGYLEPNFLASIYGDDFEKQAKYKHKGPKIIID